MREGFVKEDGNNLCLPFCATTMAPEREISVFNDGNINLKEMWFLKANNV